MNPLCARALSTLAVTVLLLVSSGLRAQTVNMSFYDTDINGLSDVLSTSFNPELRLQVSIPSPIDSGTVTITLPDEFFYDDGYRTGHGSVKSVSASGKNITITLDKTVGSAGSSFLVWLYLEPQSSEDRVLSSQLKTIAATGNLLGYDGKTYEIADTFETALIYSTGTTSSSKDGASLQAGDEFTIDVTVEPFNLYDVYYSSISVNVPYQTDLVPGSISGLTGGYERYAGQVYAEYPSGGIRGFSFSFRVKVRDQLQLDYFKITEITLNKPVATFRVRTPYTGNLNDPTRTFHRRILSTNFATPTPIPIAVPSLDIIVNSTGDAARDATKAGGVTGNTIANGDPECTLRSAIQAVNAGVGDRIQFDIPGDGIPTIPLLSALPAVTVPVEIDATTQDAGRVEVRGNGSEFSGLDLRGGDSTVKGLVINGFTGADNAAIKLSVKGNNKILGNYIGVDKTAATAVATAVGILIDGSADNQIGSATAADQNIIAADVGILIKGEEPNANLVLNNRIGLSLTDAFISTGVSILISSGDDLKIGSSNAGNSLAGSSEGILVAPDSDLENLTIENNQIGLDAAGNNQANQAIGIRLGSLDGPVIDTFEIKDNKVAGFLVNVFVFGLNAKNGAISGNRVGLQFGDTQQRPGNLLSNSQKFGIRIDGSSDIVVEDNTIAGHEWNLLLSGVRQYTVENDALQLRSPLDSFVPLEGFDHAKNIRAINNRIGVNDYNEIPANSRYFAGITVYGEAENVVIESNTISKHDSQLPKTGIFLLNGKNHRVSGNVIGTTAGSTITSAIGLYISGAIDARIGAFEGGVGNVIGHNSLGVFISGTNTGAQFSGNIIGSDATGANDLGNVFGILIDETGDPGQGQPAVLFEYNTIVNNSIVGLRLSSAYEIKLVENHIGITDKNQPLPNGVGIDIGATPVVFEKNTIAHNAEIGVNLSGAASAHFTQNKIYQNGDDSGIAGIVYATAPFPPPSGVVAIRSAPDADGQVTIYLAASSPGTEEAVTYEFFTDLDREHPQGRSYLFSRQVAGGETFNEQLTVDQNHPLATTKSITATQTRNGQTSAFSIKSVVDTYEIPQLEFLPLDNDQIRIGWIKTDLFQFQEAFDLRGPWYDSAAIPFVDGQWNAVTINVSEGDQYFRLVLDPTSLLN